MSATVKSSEFALILGYLLAALFNGIGTALTGSPPVPWDVFKEIMLPVVGGFAIIRQVKKA